MYILYQDNKMIPTKLTGEPWIEPNGKRGEWIFPTDAGLLTVKEIAVKLGQRPGSTYERFRRHGVAGVFNETLKEIK